MCCGVAVWLDCTGRFGEWTLGSRIGGRGIVVESAEIYFCDCGWSVLD